MVILEGKYGMMEIPRLNKKLMAYNLLPLSLSHDNMSNIDRYSGPDRHLHLILNLD